MVILGTPYGQNPQLLVPDAIGSSPYVRRTIAGMDGSLQPKQADLDTARTWAAASHGSPPRSRRSGPRAPTGSSQSRVGIERRRKTVYWLGA
jgi:hypothetical protein